MTERNPVKFPTIVACSFAAACLVLTLVFGEKFSTTTYTVIVVIAPIVILAFLFLFYREGKKKR